MPLEDSNYISQLNPAWPVGSDGVNTSDDHHRNTKKAVQQSFPNISGEVTATQADLNILAGAATDGSPTNPVGTILQGMWTSAPNGYLICNGGAIPAEYTELIALIGPNTPNLRGKFLRGDSGSNAVDPDGPRVAGSEQDHRFQQHFHQFIYTETKPGSGIESGGEFSNTNTTKNTLGAVTGNPASETRPINVAVFHAIKW